ncbi:transcription antitermination factor NusB [Defluviitalea phaphyphila]|uniref:transcription antitermination factor NusB n=1 Tax=Defluviitalea phaphyphila TaxID=1473580 RepID=UPI00072FB07F|nr:transcription antitermination factor NusB [Defluviitalea phaphyphila]
MSRRKIREHIFTLLFQKEFARSSEEQERIDLYFEQHPNIKEEDKEFIINEFKNITQKLSEIDDLLSQYSIGWKIERMSRVDLSIFRVAIYEMYYDEDVPKSVAINEAVELAKKYSSDEAPAFINGVLGKIASSVKEVDYEK